MGYTRGKGRVTKIGHWSGNSKSFSYIDGALRHLPTLQARGAAARLIGNGGKSNEDNEDIDSTTKEDD